MAPGSEIQLSPDSCVSPLTEVQLLEQSGLFDEKFYRESNPDVTDAELSPVEHFLCIGGFQGRRPNPLFDPAYYLTIYPKVAIAGINPALHYLVSGALEGHNPSPDFDTSFYLATYRDVAASGLNPLVHFLRFGVQQSRLPLPPERYDRDLQKLHRWATGRHKQAKLDYRPLVSVLMPTYNSQPIYLKAAIRSVIAQAYPNWELRIVDDGSSNVATLETLDHIAAWDKRIFVVRNPKNRGISGATNDALQAARGEYVTMLDHDDELTVDALYEVVVTLNGDRTTDVVYTDQDYVSPDGKPAGHFFKPDWSPTLFRGVMYIGHLLTVRRSLVLEVGGFDSSFDPVQDFEFMLRVSEQTRKIRHVPKVLYHWRKIPESVAGGGKADLGIEQLQVAAVQGHLDRLHLKGHARSNPRSPHRVLIEPRQAPLKTEVDLFLHGCPPPTARFMEDILIRKALLIRRVAIPHDWVDFEMAARGNFAVYRSEEVLSEAERLCKFLAESSAEFVLVISGNVAIETTDWLELLAVAAQELDVVAACPMVLSVDGLVMHAGLIVAPDGGLKPAMAGFPPDVDGYAGSLSCAREVSAVRADVVLLRRSLLATLLQPEPMYTTTDFFVADLTLRATTSGLRVVCVPYVRARRLRTIEASAESRLDAALQRDIWSNAAIRDSFYNPNFRGGHADYT
jgi:O-antigen biosynthesis protein